MNKNSCSDPISWVSEQIQQLNKLVKIFYENDNTNMSFDSYVKIRGHLHKAECSIDEMVPESDISTCGYNRIFTPYRESGGLNKSFEEYFNNCLIPDMSPAGFLEELDRLIQITRDRKVIITTSGTEDEMKQVKVLEDYLSDFPPF